MLFYIQLCRHLLWWNTVIQLLLCENERFTCCPRLLLCASGFPRTCCNIFMWYVYLNTGRVLLFIRVWRSYHSRKPFFTIFAQIVASTKVVVCSRISINKIHLKLCDFYTRVSMQTKDMLRRLELLLSRKNTFEKYDYICGFWWNHFLFSCQQEWGQ